MSISAYGLQDIKKELQHLNSLQLTDLVLRLVRHKKENKELLAYMLFLSHDEQAFIEQTKYETGLMFYIMPSQAYQAAKVLRKILRFIGKNAKFAASKTVEIALLMGFCRNYMDFVDKKSNYKPLRQILVKQLEKIRKLIGQLHEDLQFDFTGDYNVLVNDLDKTLPWLNKIEHLL